MYNINNYYY